MQRMPSTEPGVDETFRARVRMRAADLRITHQQLAERLTEGGLDLKRASVSQIITGKMRAPRLDEIVAWANALETTKDFLLGGTWNPNEGRTTEG